MLPQELALSLARIRALLCDRLLVVLAVLALPLLAITLVRGLDIGFSPLQVLQTQVAVAIIAMALLRRHFSLAVKAAFILIVLHALSIAGMLHLGLLSAALLYLVVPPALAVLLFGTKAALACLGLPILTFAAIGGLMVAGDLSLPVDANLSMRLPSVWAVELVSLLAISGGLAYALHGYGAELVALLARALDSEARTRAALAEQTAAEAIARRAQKVALMAIADLAEYRDHDTGEHVLRVARLAHEIARNLKEAGIEPESCDQPFLEHIGLASILHDVGKVSIPDSILLKPGKLTPEERTVMEKHTAAGGAILDKATRLLPESVHFRLAREIAANHHEHWDGAGYPNGLKGRAIPLAARIVAVADVFDALTIARPYKDPWPLEKALAFIDERCGSQFDPEVVTAFHKVLKSRDASVTVEWSDAIAIGHGAVDQDHRILVHLINQMANSENAQDPAAVGFVLDELTAYTQFHFAREEVLLEQAGYPHLAEHKRLHAAMIADVESMQRRYLDHDSNVGDLLSQYLARWLVNHIMQEDRRYAPYVQPPGPGGGEKSATVDRVAASPNMEG